MNTTELFNSNWFFSKQKLNTSVSTVNKSKSKWEPVEIPHDWLIYNVKNLYESGEGWYKKELDITELDLKNILFLRFEGIYMDSAIYVNNNLVYEWKYGYSTFETEITNNLTKGSNTILVSVKHQQSNSRWYSGAGIYRKVLLRRVSDIYLISDGTYIRTEKNSDNWSVKIDTEISVVSNSSDDVTIQQTILNSSGSVVSTSKRSINCDYLNKNLVINSCLTVVDPAIWGVLEPNLYTLKTELYSGLDLIEESIQNFGFRAIEFHPEKGFLLNNQVTKLKGICQHHDLGALGAAVNKVALKRQMTILKEMGVNAIRTSHNMPAVELMELADEMGFLISSESFDMWERPKNMYDYARFFTEWVQKDVASWVRRDRNHPSIIMWCIGNEVYDTHADKRGEELTQMLLNMVKQHDPSCNASVTLASNYLPWENTQKCADIVKLVGYNYGETLYKEHHKQHPDWIIYGSETASTVQSRGIYHFPFSQSVLSDDDKQCSSLGNSTTSWGAKNSEACIIADRDSKFSPGQFIWTGFDYIGEPTPYHTKNSYLGQIDTAGFKKDSFYIYKAEWTDYKEEPMVHIFPYWDFSEGQLIDIRVCSNAPRVELFFNGSLVGDFKIDHFNGKKLVGDWQIPYSKGTLKALAYDENDNIIAQDNQCSFSEPTQIIVEPDKTEILADGCDLIFVEITTKDINGIRVENANNRVEVLVEGSGRLIGLDNGDSTDYDEYKGSSRRLFSGKLLAIIGSKQQAGTIKVRVKSVGFKDKTVELNAIPSPAISGSSITLLENEISSQCSEVPVRKIELICKSGTVLDSENRTVQINARILPENATYQDLEWRVTNDAGIDTNLADIVPETNSAIVTAQGDGSIRVRCATKNGGDHINLFSQIELEIIGLGERFLDPYNFISGGLYNSSNKELGNGNERGVATLRGQESFVGFKKIDFGAYGADKITMSLFPLEQDEFPIEIWEGMPRDKGSELLTTVTYTRGSKWNTYQDETYTLPRKLKGVTTLCFVFNIKVHIKGFWFDKVNRAFEQLEATENSRVYGDSFSVKIDAIEDIGNNVTLEFEGLDFTKRGFSKLLICGSSILERNSIHIKFNGDDEQSTQIADFTGLADYTVQEFRLESVTGLNKVSFVFLPGSQFNFKWFQFI